jgi:PAS domain S-box-containing protein
MSTRLPIKILYAEDEGFFRSVMAEFLSELAENVLVAENGQKGLELFDRYKPDLIITDIAMPLMNGLRMLKEIKKNNQGVKTVITTSYGETDYFIEAIELGVDRFILKPFEKKILTGIIHDLAGGILNEKKIREEEEKRRRAENELKESENRFRTIFESAPQPIILFDASTTAIIDLNTAALHLLLFQQEELKGVLARHIMSDSGWLTIKQDAKLENAGIEIFLYTRDGKEIPVNVNHTHIYVKGQPVSFGIFTDLTNRKKAEEAIWNYQNKLEDLVQKRTAQFEEANLLLKLEVKDRQLAQEKLVRRISIENLITAISTTFINLPANRISTEIRDALHQIAFIAEIERVFLWVFDPATTCLNERIVWAEETNLPKADIPNGFDFKRLDYLYQKLINNQTVIVEDADHLPADIPEMALIRRNGTRSFVMMPLMAGGKLCGMIGMDSFRHYRFDDDVLFLLSIAGKVFMDALIRKQTAMALVDSEEKARALLNASPDAMVLLDSEGHYLEVNEVAASGMPDIDTLKKLQVNYFEGLPPEVGAGRKKNFKRAIRTGRKTELLDTYQGISYEHVFFPIANSNGEIERLAILSRDITVQLNSQAKIKSQVYFLQVLINNIPNPVYYKDTNGCYLGCNNAFLKALGRSMDEIIGKTIYEIEDPITAAEYSARDTDLLKSRNIQQFEAKLRFANNQLHDVLFNKSVFYQDDGTLGGIVGIIIDISELKRIQNELEDLNTTLEKRVADELKKTSQQQQMLIQKSKLESLGKLAAGIAHEINQPLSAISLGLENLLFRINQNRVDENYIREKVGSMFDHIKRMKIIIEHVRTFSRDQQGHELAKVNLNEAVKGSLLLLGTQYKSSQITIRQKLNEESLIFKGNLFRLEQVIVNLLNNAKDALEEKAGQAGIKFAKTIFIRTFSDQNNVVLEIEDNGSGIAQENIQRVFEPFFTTKEMSKGTGLGLSIVYGIVEEMKGQVSVRSTLGECTCFRIAFPAAEPFDDRGKVAGLL